MLHVSYVVGEEQLLTTLPLSRSQTSDLGSRTQGDLLQVLSDRMFDEG
jgi:hypothetical protein